MVKPTTQRYPVDSSAGGLLSAGDGVWRGVKDSTAMYDARCHCGWRGEEREEKDGALSELVHHLERHSRRQVHRRTRRLLRQQRVPAKALRRATARERS